MSEKNLNYKSCFDIIGPIMIGPSSSHTAGAIAIGAVARKLLQWEPKTVDVYYYESFAETHKGHGTDFAIVSGILEFATDDERVPQAVAIARDKGIDVTFYEMPGDSPYQHANTAEIVLSDGYRTVKTAGISVGGGMIEVKMIEVDGFHFKPDGMLPIVLAISKQQTLDQQLDNFFNTHNIFVRQKTSLTNDQNEYMFIYELNTIIPNTLQEALFAYGIHHRIILL